MPKNNVCLDTTLKQNIEQLKEGIGQSSDVLFQHFHIRLQSTPACLMYIEGLSETSFISDQIVLPLQNKEIPVDCNAVSYISSSILGVNSKEILTFEDIEKEMLKGKSILLIDGYIQGLALETKKVQQRAIEEPENEAMIRGPKIGSIEELRTNTALIRQRTNDANLTIKEITVRERNLIEVSTKKRIFS